MNASQRDSLVPHLESNYQARLTDVDITTLQHVDGQVEDVADGNTSVEIERMKQGSYQQSEASVIRVLDDLNTTFQSEVYRMEENASSRMSGFSDQTQMMRMRAGTNQSISQMSSTSFRRVDAGNTTYGDTTQDQILRMDDYEEDDEEDESNNFGMALFSKKQQQQQQNQTGF